VCLLTPTSSREVGVFFAAESAKTAEIYNSEIKKSPLARLQDWERVFKVPGEAGAAHAFFGED